MTFVTIPPGNLNVTQAVVAVPVGGDGNNPVSALNPPLAAANAPVTDATSIELLKSINYRLGALLLLLTNAYGLHDDPATLEAASRSIHTSPSSN